MGFFSRLFKIREQDPTSPETTWAMEDNGSELVLDAEYAATLMTEIDIDAAIASRDAYQQRLVEAGLSGITTEIVFPAPAFYYAEDEHQQYLSKNPMGYCGLGGTGVSCQIGTGA